MIITFKVDNIIYILMKGRYQEMKRENYNGIYSDMYEVLGEDVTKKIYEYYKGQQINFPMRLYSKEYMIKYISDKYNGKNIKELSRSLGYTEKWIKILINRYKINSNREEEKFQNHN